MKLPRRILALFVIVGLLFGSSGAIPASAANLVEVDIENPAADLRAYNITYGQWTLFTVEFSEWDNLDAGESRLIACHPTWTTQPDAPETGQLYVEWDIPGFGGVQWGSSDESILRIQPPQNPDSPLVWLTTLREGAASVQLILPNDVIVSREVNVLPAQDIYSRPEELTITPTAVRAPIGSTASLTVKSLVPALDTVFYVDWASTDPSVAVVDQMSMEEMFAVMSAADGQCPVRVNGLTQGTAVITLSVMAIPSGTGGDIGGDDEIVLDYLSFKVVVSDDEGDDPDDGDAQVRLPIISAVVDTIWESIDFLEILRDFIIENIESFGWLGVALAIVLNSAVDVATGALEATAVLLEQAVPWGQGLPFFGNDLGALMLFIGSSPFAIFMYFFATLEIMINGISVDNTNLSVMAEIMLVLVGGGIGFLFVGPLAFLISIVIGAVFPALIR